MGNGEMKLNRYPKYKPTGIAWLPEVPEGWEVKRVKGLFSLRRESYSPNEQLQVLSLIKDVGVIPYEEKGQLGNKSKEDISGYNVARKGDIVMNSMNVIIGSVDITPFDGYISPAYYALTARQGVEPKYFNYLFHLTLVQKMMRSLAKGILEIRLRISITSLLGMTFPVPPLAEQRVIVAFLDGKCGKIDRWVAAKEREVALLKELKQSMIAEAVTGATNVARTNTVRKMKPSGIPWFPEVPEGWKMVKVGYCFDENGSGTTPTSGSVDYYDGEINWVQSGDLHGDDICSSKKTITDKALQDYSLKIFQPPFVCMAMYGASIANVSVVRVPACTNQACCVLAKNRKTTDLNYLYRCLSSAVVRQELLLKAQGGTQPNINRSDILGMRIPVPPLAEQREIVAYLDEKCGKIDAAVAGLEREVAAMKEYKQRLIADVVTGQRKVA